MSGRVGAGLDRGMQSHMQPPGWSRIADDQKRGAMRTAGFALWLSFAAATLSAGCGLFTGPSKSVEGTWSAPGVGHLADHFEMSLVQNADKISGVMCRADVDGVGYHDIPVAGDYPHVAFTVTFAGGGTQSFSGKYEDDRDQIAGNFGTVSAPGVGIALRFVRSDEGRCESAKGVP